MKENVDSSMTSRELVYGKGEGEQVRGRDLGLLCRVFRGGDPWSLVHLGLYRRSSLSYSAT